MTPPEPEEGRRPAPCFVPPPAGPWSLPDWPALAAGSPVVVRKLAPDGTEAARYPATVVATTGSWLSVAARWTNDRIVLDGLTFAPGDRLLEYFSPREPFNAFAVYGPREALRGWYANVTFPPTLDLSVSPPLLTWHDRYLDLILLPDGTAVLRDEDELAASGLAIRNPAAHADIVAARDRLLATAADRAFPFDRP